MRSWQTAPVVCAGRDWCGIPTLRPMSRTRESGAEVIDQERGRLMIILHQCPNVYLDKVRIRL